MFGAGVWSIGLVPEVIGPDSEQDQTSSLDGVYDGSATGGSAPVLTPDLQALVTAAVESALAPEPIPTPPPTPDLQVISAAVEAAQADQTVPSPASANGPNSDRQQFLTAAQDDDPESNERSNLPFFPSGLAGQSDPHESTFEATPAPSSLTSSLPTPTIAQGMTPTPAPVSTHGVSLEPTKQPGFSPEPIFTQAPERSFLQNRTTASIALGVIGVLIVIAAIGTVKNW